MLVLTKKDQFTVNPLLSPLGGLFILSPFEGSCLRGGGGLFDLEMTMVSVLDKELEYTKWKSSSTRPFRSLQRRIRINSELPVGK